MNLYFLPVLEVSIVHEYEHRQACLVLGHKQVEYEAVLVSRTILRAPKAVRGFKHAVPRRRRLGRLRNRYTMTIAVSCLYEHKYQQASLVLWHKHIEHKTLLASRTILWTHMLRDCGV